MLAAPTTSNNANSYRHSNSLCLVDDFLSLQRLHLHIPVLQRPRLSLKLRLILISSPLDWIFCSGNRLLEDEDFANWFVYGGYSVSGESFCFFSSLLLLLLPILLILEFSPAFEFSSTEMNVLEWRRFLSRVLLDFWLSFENFHGCWCQMMMWNATSLFV